MKKLILATTAFTAMTAAAFASCATPAPTTSDDHFRSGFYLGANAGVGYHTNKLTNGLNELASGVNNSFLKKSKNKFSALGEILLGGRYKMNKWLMGMEVSGNMDGNKASRTFIHTDALGDPVPIHTKVKKEYGIVPALVFGHQFNEKNAMFVKLGLSINRYKISFTENYTPDRVKLSAHKTKLGFAPTVGIEHSFTRNLSGVASLGAEFNGSVKKKFTNDPQFLNSAGEFLSVKNKTNSYTAKIGILWKL